MNARHSADRALRFGTRGSALAMRQTAAVVQRLRDRSPTLPVERVVIRTEGDVDKTSPLTVIGGRGVFTSALQDALRRGEIDAAVHSAKDLPSEQPVGLHLIAFPEREDSRDVLVSRHRCPLAALPPRPTVGTSSRRRAVQVLSQRPDARIVELRGNVDTRLRKAMETELDAIVLAAAGLRRLGWHDRVCEALPLERFVPSPGQGALAVETRVGDREVEALLAPLDDPAVAIAVRVERAFLRAVGGGCTAPIAAHVVPAGDHLRLLAMLGSEDGRRVEWVDERLDPGRAAEAAAEIAERMLALVGGADGTTFGSVPLAKTDVSALGEPHALGPLTGWTVLNTRAREQAAPLSTALRLEGAEPLELPTIRIVDPVDPEPLHHALERLAAGAYDWVVFTSANGVARVLARLDLLQIDRVLLAAVSVAVVGEATAEAVRAAGLRVDVVPDRFVAEAVVAALAAHDIAGRRVLFPCADLARDTLPCGLRRLGAKVDAVEAYRTVPATAIDPDVLGRLLRGEVDVVTFASASAVRNLAALLGGGLDPLHGAAVACVGPVTATAVREFGLTLAVVAADATIAGLVAALVQYRTGGRGNGRSINERDRSTGAVAGGSPLWGKGTAV